MIGKIEIVLVFANLQLIDRGIVNVKDVASEIGISPDSFYSKLAVIPK